MIKTLLIDFSDLQNYCTIFKKRVFPLFRDHICESEKENVFDHRQIMQQIKKNSKILKEKRFLSNEKEMEIFEENLLSLRIIEHSNDLKYCMIAMGSILEFLLIKYCMIKKLRCEDYYLPGVTTRSYYRGSFHRPGHSIASWKKVC